MAATLQSPSSREEIHLAAFSSRNDLSRGRHPAELEELLENLPAHYGVQARSFDHALVAAKAILQYYYGNQCVAYRLQTSQENDEIVARYTVKAHGASYEEVAGGFTDAEREEWTVDYIEAIHQPEELAVAESDERL